MKDLLRWKCSRLGLVILLSVISVRGDERRPKALLIMLDGVRADALENASAPNLSRLMTDGWAPGYSVAWSLSGRVIPDARPSSAGNHTALATGVSAAKTGVNTSAQMKTAPYDTWPTWLTRVTGAGSGRTALFAFSWIADAAFPQTPGVTFVHDTDERNVGRMQRELAAAETPDALMYFVDLPDHAGHCFGFYPSAVEYLHQVSACDRIVGRLMETIRSRPTFAQEDWLVLITSDHGGWRLTHGLWGGICNTIPVIVVGRHVPNGRLPGLPHPYDLTATALAHFGQDTEMLGLDGRKLTVALPEPVERPLADGLAAYLPFSDAVPSNVVASCVVARPIGTNAVSGTACGFADGGLRCSGKGGIRLEGSENLAFEHGTDFAATVWVRIPDGQTGDPVIFSNKDVMRTDEPGLSLCSLRATEQQYPGVCVATVRPEGRPAGDMGTFGVETNSWTFYAVTRTADGVLDFYQGSSDGRLYWISEQAAEMTLGSLPFHLGLDATGADAHAFVGEMDDFALWTRALDRREIRRIYQAGRRGLDLGQLLAKPSS